MSSSSSLPSTSSLSAAPRRLGARVILAWIGDPLVAPFVVMFGVVFAWSAWFTSQSDVAALVERDRSTETARGTVSRVVEQRRNKKRYTSEVQVDVAGHGTFTAFIDRPVRAGDTVDVAWPPGRFDRARVQGGRRALHGAQSALVPLLASPVMVIALVAVHRRNGAHALFRLLREGALTRARKLTKEQTGTDKNGKPIWKVTLGYEVDGVDHTLSLAGASGARFGDDPEGEPILYDPRAPSVAVALDTFGAGFRVDAGRVVVTNPRSVAVGGLVVALVVVACVAWAATLFVELTAL